MGRGAIDRFVRIDDLLRPDVDYARPPGGGAAFFDLIGEVRGRRVLDLGCGTGTYREPLERRGARWVGLDLGGPAASVLGDAGRLPFAGGSFDGVLCSAVLEHLPEPETMLREIHRVLAPGGRVFGYVAFLEPFHGMSYFHMTHMGLEYLLLKNGFRPARIFPSHVGAGYQLEAILFPRPVPVLQPAFRVLARGGLALALAAARAARAALFRARGRPVDGERFRRLQALKFTSGLNFVAERTEGPPAPPEGYRALVRTG